MIKLKVIQKGIFLEIPGIKPIRTPAEVDITNIDITLVLSYLRKNGINRYQIISEDEKTKIKEIITETDIKKKTKYDSDIDKKINNLESMMTKLLELQQAKSKLDLEQIPKRFNQLETKVNNNISKEKIKKPEIEELDLSFIPEIDLSTMEVKGTTTHNVINQENEDLEDKADLLSRLINNSEE